ncbi:hypothetical protein BDN67DRAFT_982319 [Paxillus ammoniavirescens]|nr:hypothetical protein BDN67DRAFT_982319 [Paxillus ammoniavirescens]
MAGSCRADVESVTWRSMTTGFSIVTALWKYIGRSSDAVVAVQVARVVSLTGEISLGREQRCTDVVGDERKIAGKLASVAAAVAAVVSAGSELLRARRGWVRGRQGDSSGEEEEDAQITPRTEIVPKEIGGRMSAEDDCKNKENGTGRLQRSDEERSTLGMTKLLAPAQLRQRAKA